MKMLDYFFIEGEKALIFRKEGDKYITFDPEWLEFFKLYHIAEIDIIYFILRCSFSTHIKNTLKKLGVDSETIS